MYMPGRLRTASRPSRTVMELPVYSFFLPAVRAGLATGTTLPRLTATREATVTSGGAGRCWIAGFPRSVYSTGLKQTVRDAADCAAEPRKSHVTREPTGTPCGK